jgi:hypothetical protein
VKSTRLSWLVSSTAKGGDPVTKTLALIAVALGVVAASAGSAFAGCGSHSVSQSVSLDTQTASTGDTHAPYTPVPESSSD